MCMQHIRSYMFRFFFQCCWFLVPSLDKLDQHLAAELPCHICQRWWRYVAIICCWCCCVTLTRSLCITHGLQSLIKWDSVGHEWCTTHDIACRVVALPTLGGGFVRVCHWETHGFHPTVSLTCAEEKKKNGPVAVRLGEACLTHVPNVICVGKTCMTWYPSSVLRHHPFSGSFALNWATSTWTWCLPLRE